MDDETAVERVLPRAPELLGEVMPGDLCGRPRCDKGFLVI
jgi:hypothetical protein